MQPEQYDKAYLWDMLDAALAIQSFIQGKNFNDYTKDRMLRGANVATIHIPELIAVIQSILPPDD
jgi:uncharacterized protein with HEPN domain